MSKWGKTHTDSGILRKNDGPEKTEDLLVFGYACKLFRDDEKALEIDQGKHLIPWMGDDTLKIDRYDGRGALADLSQYEASAEGYDTARWSGLTDAERRVEQLCDEERYRALLTNEDEEQMYREEELKRLHQLNNEKNYGQVSYSYDSSKPEETRDDKPTPADSEDDEPFVPPPDLDLPINMTIPKTIKQNARIEKTAMFISQQGAQMEILIKAKQAGNPQFDFLLHDSPLYRYYRHILMAIKTGRYRRTEPEKPAEPQETEDNDHYLHPSLAPVPTRVESAPSIPNITYKPSADCAYTMLVSKIKGKASNVVDEPQEVTKTSQPNDSQSSSQPPPAQTTVVSMQSTSTSSMPYNFPPNSTYIYNYNTGKYEPAPPPVVYVPNSYDQTKPYTGDSSYTQPYPQPPGQYESANLNDGVNQISKEAVLYYNENTPTSIPILSEPIKPVKEKPKPLLPIAHYSSGSDSESETDNDNNESQVIINRPLYEIPPSDVQLIIDKMASYVARNGRDFESIVRSNGDPRFVFLDANHIYNAYYKHKLKMYGGVVEETNEKVQSNSSDQVDQVASENNVTEVKKGSPKLEKSKKIITPVCFSIKKPKEPEPVAIERSALPVEESSDESDSNETKTHDEGKAVEITQVLEPVDESQAGDDTTKDNISSSKDEKVEVKDGKVIEIEDSVQELIDLTDDCEEKRDARRAEDKIKDKLAAAAREKLLLCRNRELQIERKRRAAMFLSKIKSDDVLPLNGNGSENVARVEDAPIVHSAEEDDLMKRICDLDTEAASSGSHSETNGRHGKRSRSRHRSPDRHRHSSRKKRKKRNSSSESSQKRSKHRSEGKHSKKRNRSRSRSRSHRSRSSRSSSHRSSRSRNDSDKYRRRDHSRDSHRKNSEQSKLKTSDDVVHSSNSPKSVNETIENQ